jgi:hypothetical protein
LHERVRIGCGAGFAGDRVDAAVAVVDALCSGGGQRFLIYETLAERTLALLQLERRRDPGRGYAEALDRFLASVLARCLDNGIRIVGNFGAANPRAAAARIRALAATLGYPAVRVGVVEGDDLTGILSPADFARRETGGALLEGAPPVIAANAYLGGVPIAEALGLGADVVVTGRVADSALALGPLLSAFGWRLDDWDRLAAGTLIGHLLECGAQVTGGYFADPGVKDVPGLSEVGYPIAEVEEDGGFVITKPPGTGGRVDRLTVTEQALYEVHDPAAYLAPDVVLDLTDVSIEELGPDRVRVSGARGRPRPETLKATVCIDGGVLGEAEISYAGPNAARARGSPRKLFGTGSRAGVPTSPSGSMPSVLSAFSATAAARCWRTRAASRRTSACGLPRSLPTRHGSNVCSTRWRRSIAPGRPAAPGFGDA